MSSKNYADFDEMEIKKYITSDPNRYHALCLLKVRDNFAKQDYTEAYHWLYAIASPQFDKYEPWEELEKIAGGEPLESPTRYTGTAVAVDQLSLAEEVYNRLNKFGASLTPDAITIIQSAIAGRFPVPGEEGVEGAQELLKKHFSQQTDYDCDELDRRIEELKPTSLYRAAINAISGALSVRQQVDVKEIQRKLIWAMIEEWQDADDNEFSKNDIEVELYDWLKKIDEGNVKSPASLPPGIVDNIRNQNPYKDHQFDWYGQRRIGWSECCDTLARIIEGEKGKEEGETNDKLKKRIKFLEAEVEILRKAAENPPIL